MVKRDIKGRFMKGHNGFYKDVGIYNIIEDIKIMYEHGFSLQDIASLCGITKQGIRYHMKKNNIEIRRRGKHTILSKKKLSENHNKKSNLKGNKNSNWKGGITPYTNKLRNSIRYKEWRKEVYERDDYTCQECNQRGNYLNAHHIFPFCKLIKTTDENLIFDIKNGITLCLICHDLTKEGGRT